MAMVGASPLLSPPLILLFLTFLSSSSSSPPDKIPYADHCRTIVPQSVPKRLLVHSNSFRISKGYFSGGGHLLESDSNSDRPMPKSFEFQADDLHQTEDPSIIQVHGTLVLYGGSTRVERNSTDSIDGSFVRHSFAVRKQAIFDLSGFWSKSAGRFCMVGRGSLAHDEEGSSVQLSAVFKLNYPEESNIATSLVRGTVESLDASDSANHFSSIQILAYAQRKYEYTMIPQVRGSCSRHNKFEVESVAFDSSSFCPRLRRYAGRFFRLDYDSDCSGRNCGPFGKSLELFMSLNLIQCPEEGRLHLHMDFSNVSGHSYSSFLPDKSLVGEGFWDEGGNRLCLMACRILSVQGDSLEAASVGDCTIGFSLWFPEVLSIKSTSSAVGRIWSTKKKDDVGYFSQVSFSSLNDDFGLVSGSKYNYTKLDTVRKLCAVNDAAKLGKRKYPDGRSLDQMRFGFHPANTSGEIGWGQATPISVSETHYHKTDPGYVAPISVDERYHFYGDIDSHMISKPARTLGKTEQTHWDVSYKMSSTFGENGAAEISAEGIYDANTGTLCMVGCWYPRSSIASKQGQGADNSIDCEMLINIQIPPLNPDLEERFSGTIKSTRKKSDPLFFDSFEILTYAFSTILKAVWRMDVEIIMVLISLTLSCIFIRMQFYHVKKHSPSMSITMLVVLTLGHMIPLMLNFEALFSKKDSLLRRSARWVEANEVIVRAMTMVAFLLHLRLLQVAWSSRSAEKGREGLWVAEKRVAKLCSALYLAGALIVWFVHTRSFEVRVHGPDRSIERHHSLWKDLKPYCGFILDGFLLPQIVLNVFWNSEDKALNPFFYAGTTIVRAVPHLYDVFRAHHYVPHLRWSFIYADHGGDFYSTWWNIIIPCQGVLFVFLVYLQQRFGGDFILPKRFRKAGDYEMVPSP